jgi:predicted dehydrogenase
MVLKIGLVGVGAMGSNHARVIHENSRANLAKVFDVNQRAAEKCGRDWGVETASSVDELEECDAIVIASSTNTHFSLGERFAQQGKALFIEKPLGSTLEETTKLLTLCEANQVPIMCGFVERFNPAVITALKMLDEPVRHLMSYRHSPFNPRASSGVVTDLLIHDLDLTARVAPTEISPRIGASIWAPSLSSFSETVDCTLQFGDQMTAVQSASRWGQRKIRDIRLSTDNLLLELDLIRVTVTAYRHRSNPDRGSGDPVSYRSETMIEVPFVRHAGEPLGMQFDHFVDIIEGVADRRTELDSIEKPHAFAAAIEHHVV